MMYIIVSGNDDRAFFMDSGGIVKTSILLDREIQSAYTLTIAAVNMAAPMYRTSCQLAVKVLDRNDNQPTFPPQSLVRIREGMLYSLFGC